MCHSIRAIQNRGLSSANETDQAKSGRLNKKAVIKESRNKSFKGSKVANSVKCRRDVQTSSKIRRVDVGFDSGCP